MSRAVTLKRSDPDQPAGSRRPMPDDWLAAAAEHEGFRVVIPAG
jgi:hypothetical protein